MEDPKQKDSSYETVSLLTHRNDLAVPLATSLASHLKRKSDIPASILSFMKISQDISRGAHSIRPGMLFTISQLERPNPSATPVQYQAPSLPIRITSLHTADSASSSQPSNSALKPRKVFYPIDPNSSLQNCLRNRSFVEWPTIDIFPSRQTFAEGRFGDLAEGTNVGPTTLLGEEGPNKRRKTETGLVQLIGGYGEESESEAEDPKPRGVEGLGISGLGDYASDEDEANGVDKG
ncbi:hypothetical protein FRC07_008094 [Ceratobasidium sp. 392]|nr:hypothetical protein FRC07_008094 [Ceratobasidium sp. 392]